MPHDKNIFSDTIIILICSWFVRRMYTLTITPISFTIAVYKNANSIYFCNKFYVNFRSKK